MSSHGPCCRGYHRVKSYGSVQAVSYQATYGMLRADYIPQTVGAVLGGAYRGQTYTGKAYNGAAAIIGAYNTPEATLQQGTYGTIGINPNDATNYAARGISQVGATLRKEAIERGQTIDDSVSNPELIRTSYVAQPVQSVAVRRDLLLDRIRNAKRMEIPEYQVLYS